MRPPDISQRYVHVIRTLTTGFVEFEFTIADRDLSVELILPVDAFNEFCITNDVSIMEEDKKR